MDKENKMEFPNTWRDMKDKEKIEWINENCPDA